MSIVSNLYSRVANAEELRKAAALGVDAGLDASASKTNPGMNAVGGPADDNRAADGNGYASQIPPGPLGAQERGAGVKPRAPEFNTKSAPSQFNAASFRSI